MCYPMDHPYVALKVVHNYGQSTTTSTNLHEREYELLADPSLPSHPFILYQIYNFTSQLNDEVYSCLPPDVQHAAKKRVPTPGAVVLCV